jgi:hypothetical protein
MEANTQQLVSTLEKELEEVKSRLSRVTNESLKLRTERFESLTVSECQQKRIAELENQLLDRVTQQSLVIDTLIKEQVRTESLSSELSDSQKEVKTLKKQLADLRHEAEQDNAAALLELGKLGAVAVSEINKLGQITKEQHAQKIKQASLIMILKKRLQEHALKSETIEFDLREQLSQERAKIDSMESSKSEPSLGLLTLKIPEENADNEENDSVLSPSVGNPGFRSDLSAGGTDSVTSAISQGSLLEGIIDSKRRSSLWARFSLPEKTDENKNLNTLLQRRDYDFIDPFSDIPSTTQDEYLKDREHNNLQSHNAAEE